MSKQRLWRSWLLHLALVGFVLGTVRLTLALSKRSEARESAPAPAAAPPPPAPSGPTCLREKRAHIFGTYRISTYQREERDYPVDLTYVECLEWSK